jgi:hypothetical protein
MFKQIPLTAEFLALIQTVQSFRQFRLHYHIWQEEAGKAKGSWYADTQEFYNSLDDELLARFSLCKNGLNFEEVLNFDIVPEMLTTNYDELPKKFQFTVWTYK